MVALGCWGGRLAPPGRPRGVEQFALGAPRRAGGDRFGFDMESSRGLARFVLGLNAPVPETALGQRGRVTSMIGETRPHFHAFGCPYTDPRLFVPSRGRLGHRWDSRPRLSEAKTYREPY